MEVSMLDFSDSRDETRDEREFFACKIVSALSQ